MNLHDKIMNIPPSRTDSQGYLIGHRDARHAAAELAVKQDALVAQLCEALEDCVLIVRYLVADDGLGTLNRAEAALAAARGEVGQ